MRPEKISKFSRMRNLRDEVEGEKDNVKLMAELKNEMMSWAIRESESADKLRAENKSLKWMLCIYSLTVGILLGHIFLA